MATASDDAARQTLGSAGLTNNRYFILKMVGKGNQGHVFAASCVDPLHSTEERVAIKLVRLPAGNKERLRMLSSEIRISNLLSAHPHIVAVRDLVVTPPDPTTGDRHVGIVMDLANCSMQHLVDKTLTKPLKEDMVCWWFKQLILAVEHCHAKEVGQRDVKPGNILMFGKSMQIRLADFGLSKQLDVSEAKTPTGTLIYMAPEILSDAYRRYDAKKADVWSCGVVLFQLLFPTVFNAVLEKLKKSHQGSYHVRYTQWAQHLPEQGTLLDRDQERSEHAVGLLRLMLQEDPAQRITLSGIREHPWFTSAGARPTAAEMEDMQRVAKDAPPLLPDAKLRDVLLSCLS